MLNNDRGAAGSILYGTLKPLIDDFGGAKLSVGLPWFNSVFVLLMLLLFLPSRRLFALVETPLAGLLVQQAVLLEPCRDADRIRDPLRIEFMLVLPVRWRSGSRRILRLISTRSCARERAFGRRAAQSVLDRHALVTWHAAAAIADQTVFFRPNAIFA